jgi:predicted MPP superfamily phosphohydrolase
MPLWTRVRAGAARLFYRYFFRLLLVTASAAQWAVVAWVISVSFDRPLPWQVHPLAVAALYICNRALTRAGSPRRGRLFRVYTATAFVALFCSMFLLVTAVVFAVMHGVLGVLSAQALAENGRAMLDAGVDGAFRWVASIGMTVIALMMGYGYTVGQRQLRVTRTSLALDGLARPLRIAQISDIHVGQNLTVPELRGFVERVNATEPDLICITGDIVDSPRTDCAVFLPVLAELRARFGVCAILGNHDHSAGAERVMAALQQLTPFRVLRDGAVTLELGTARLHVIGLDDRGRDWARGVESDGRLADLLDAAPPGLPVLLLSHRPDIFRQAAAARVSLTLSGHTHGGQLAVPWFGGARRNLAEFVTAFDRGLYQSGTSYLYVNSGLGVTGQRIRLFTPREISIFELLPA